MGLREVTNPSELFLSERPLGVSGSTVVASMEGTRPVLVEIQALVAPTTFSFSEANGIWLRPSSTVTCDCRAGETDGYVPAESGCLSECSGRGQAG